MGDNQLTKLKSFNFDHLLPKVACTRYYQGGLHDKNRKRVEACFR